MALLPLSYPSRCKGKTTKVSKKRSCALVAIPMIRKAGAAVILAKLVNAGHDVSIIYLYNR